MNATSHPKDDLAAASMEERYYQATQWQLIWRKFRRHKLAQFGGVVLSIMYLSAFFCGFFSPSIPTKRHRDFVLAPPQRVRIFDQGKLRWPFVYGLHKDVDMMSTLVTYTPNKSEVHHIRFFGRGEKYTLLGVFRWDIHFVVANEGAPFFVFGTDRFGRDLLTRTLYASRVSLSVGLLGVAMSFVIGLVLGGISGYYGGTADVIIQRAIEFFTSLPTIPVWMALAAALPVDWSSIRIYFAITIIVSVIGWTGLARVVRGKLLQLREEDFVIAARISGATEGRVIRRHLLPAFMSYLVVHLTLAVPAMIVGETALSFLGLGIRPPAVSWGTLLEEAQNIQTMVLYLWQLIPGLFVLVAVLAFNFLGDGLR